MHVLGVFWAKMGPKMAWKLGLEFFSKIFRQSLILFQFLKICIFWGVLGFLFFFFFFLKLLFTLPCVISGDPLYIYLFYNSWYVIYLQSRITAFALFKEVGGRFFLPFAFLISRIWRIRHFLQNLKIFFHCALMAEIMQICELTMPTLNVSYLDNEERFLNYVKTGDVFLPPNAQMW